MAYVVVHVRHFKKTHSVQCICLYYYYVSVIVCSISQYISVLFRPWMTFMGPIRFNIVYDFKGMESGKKRLRKTQNKNIRSKDTHARSQKVVFFSLWLGNIVTKFKINVQIFNGSHENMACIREKTRVIYLTEYKFKNKKEKKKRKVRKHISKWSNAYHFKWNLYFKGQCVIILVLE